MPLAHVGAGYLELEVDGGEGTRPQEEDWETFRSEREKSQKEATPFLATVLCVFQCTTHTSYHAIVTSFDIGIA